MSNTDQQTVAPLAGLKVLEFSHTIMGPCAGLLLADLGADVIKVEPAPDGDKTRLLPGFASGFFSTFNRNKRSIAINLKTTEGQAVIHKLAEQADIVLDNYGPGTMAKLKCDWEDLAPTNPRLIYLSLKGFLKGPWQNRPALDEVVQFHSGIAYMTGPPGQPLRAGASIVDILGAVFGVTAALAALRQRDATGVGQRVGSSLFESAAFLMASHIAGGAAMGETVPPMTARKGAWGVYDVFKAESGEPLFIGVTSDVQWQRFCQVFGLDSLKNNEQLATNPQRTHAREWLIPCLAEHFRKLSLKSMIDGCHEADISWAPVGRPEDLLTNEQLQAPGGLLDTALDSINISNETNPADPAQHSSAQVALPALPLEFGDDRKRLGLRRQPPRLGEHTEGVLLESGFTQAAINDLQTKGIAL
ncbi:MAG: CaiB/BaiF CoA transferase family protein [Granulosicoccus sp.]